MWVIALPAELYPCCDVYELLHRNKDRDSGAHTGFQRGGGVNVTVKYLNIRTVFFSKTQGQPCWHMWARSYHNPIKADCNLSTFNTL